MDTEKLQFTQILRFSDAEVWQAKEDRASLFSQGALEVFYNKEIDLMFLRVNDFKYGLDRSIKIFGSFDDSKNMRSYILPDVNGFFLLKEKIPSDSPSVANLENIFEKYGKLYRGRDLENQLKSYDQSSGLFSKGQELVKEAAIKGGDLLSKGAATVTGQTAKDKLNPNHINIRQVQEMILVDESQANVESFSRDEALKIKEDANEISKRQSGEFWDSLMIEKNEVTAEAKKVASLPMRDKPSQGEEKSLGILETKDEDKQLKREDEMHDISEMPEVVGEKSLLTKAKDEASKATFNIIAGAGELTEKAKEGLSQVSSQISQKAEDLKESLTQSSSEVSQKADDLKEQASQKASELKESERKLEGKAQESLSQASSQVSQKAGELKEKASQKAEEVSRKEPELKGQAQEKWQEITSKLAGVPEVAGSKQSEIQGQAKGKLEELGSKISEKAEELKGKAEGLKERVVPEEEIRNIESQEQYTVSHIEEELRHEQHKGEGKSERGGESRGGSQPSTMQSLGSEGQEGEATEIIKEVFHKVTDIIAEGVDTLRGVISSKEPQEVAGKTSQKLEQVEQKVTSGAGELKSQVKDLSQKAAEKAGQVKEQISTGPHSNLKEAGEELSKEAQETIEKVNEEVKHAPHMKERVIESQGQGHGSEVRSGELKEQVKDLSKKAGEKISQAKEQISRGLYHSNLKEAGEELSKEAQQTIEKINEEVKHMPHMQERVIESQGQRHISQQSHEHHLRAQAPSFQPTEQTHKLVEKVEEALHEHTSLTKAVQQERIASTSQSQQRSEFRGQREEDLSHEEKAQRGAQQVSGQLSGRIHEMKEQFGGSREGQSDDLQGGRFEGKKEEELTHIEKAQKAAHQGSKQTGSEGGQQLESQGKGFERKVEGEKPSLGEKIKQGAEKATSQISEKVEDIKESTEERVPLLDKVIGGIQSVSEKISHVTSHFKSTESGESEGQQTTETEESQSHEIPAEAEEQHRAFRERMSDISEKYCTHKTTPGKSLFCRVNVHTLHEEQSTESQALEAHEANIDETISKEGEKSTTQKLKEGISEVGSKISHKISDTKEKIQSHFVHQDKENLPKVA